MIFFDIVIPDELDRFMRKHSYFDWEKFVVDVCYAKIVELEKK